MVCLLIVGSDGEEVVFKCKSACAICWVCGNADSQDQSSWTTASLIVAMEIVQSNGVVVTAH